MALKTPAHVFFFMLREARKIWEHQHNLKMIDMAYIQSISLADAKYYQSVREYFWNQIELVNEPIKKSDPIEPEEAIKIFASIRGV